MYRAVSSRVVSSSSSSRMLLRRQFLTPLASSRASNGSNGVETIIYKKFCNSTILSSNHRQEDHNSPANAPSMKSFAHFTMSSTVDTNGIFPFHQRRLMSTDVSSSSSSSADASPLSTAPKDFEETMDKLFHDSQQPATTEGDQWFVDQALAQEPWDPKWWNLADQAINSVNFIHDMTSIGYAGSIVVTTCILRLCILPLTIRAQRAGSRMAHLQPELQMMKARYEALGTPTSAETRAFGEQMQALFKRYEVTPLASIAAPLIQAPIFIGMFFGMRKMPELFPDAMSTGGILWFTDLTIPDPTFILPIVCGLSFFATIEAGKDQMIDANPQYGPTIVNAFRAMALVMVPVITTFPSAMLCYWVPNNFITLVQSVTLRNDWVKKQFGIWDRPKPIPGQASDVGFQETMSNLVKQVKGEPTTDKEKMKRHNQEIETRKRVQQVSKAARERRRAGGGQ